MNIQKGITTLIFDLGGVLVNLDWERCVKNFNEIGVSGMENLISTTLQRGFILDYETGKISTDEFRTELRKYASRDVTDDEIDAAWTSLLDDIPEEKLQLLLDLKKKYRILMLSNTNELSFSYCEDHFFNADGMTIHDFFDKCYLSYKMHMHKPEPDIFKALLVDSGLKAEECLFLDDGIHNIKTAIQIGIQGMYIEPYSEIKLDI
ncbi:MAG: HAD family hydrolase [Paludibacteraceae bacterium]